MSPQESANALRYLLRFHPHPETVEALTLAISALEGRGERVSYEPSEAQVDAVYLCIQECEHYIPRDLARAALIAAEKARMG